jgi:glycosyltransferase involved in cell wall biosynthesis
VSKRVLLICYYFPPLGLGGIGRPLNLFRRLPQHGWDCDVLTVKPVLYRAYEPELLEGLDLSRIHRSGSYDPQRVLHLLGMRRIRSSAISSARPMAERFFPDSKVGWVGPAVRMGNRLCAQTRYDAIISTSPPVSSHQIGMKLAQRHSIPWVADFRDFWTIYRAEEVYRDERRRNRARLLLQNIRERSSAVTAVNGSIVEYLGKGDAIPNGYDPDLAELWRNEPSKEIFTIGLLGHQHDTRELDPLLKVLERTQAQNPAGMKGLRLLQVGQVDAAWMKALFAERGLEIELDLRQRQSRRDTIRILSEAHVLDLGVSDKEGPGFLPGRTFELLASGRPLLVHARPESEVARITEPRGRVCRFDESSIHKAAEELMGQIDAFNGKRYEYHALDEYSRAFSSDMLAKRFAEVLDRIV